GWARVIDPGSAATTMLPDVASRDSGGLAPPRQPVRHSRDFGAVVTSLSQAFERHLFATRHHHAIENRVVDVLVPLRRTSVRFSDFPARMINPSLTAEALDR